MKKLWQRWKDKYVLATLWVISSPGWAELPKPPDKDLADSSRDWADVGSSLAYKVIEYSCVILGALILISVAANIIKAYQVAHERQDLSHFFKMLIVGLVAAALGIGLVYAGYNIVPK